MGRALLKNPLFVLALIIALVPVLTPTKLPYVLSVLSYCGIYVILAVGLDLLMGFTGQISVGHASFFAVGAYVSAIATTKYGLSPLAAMVLGMLISGGLAYLIGRPILALKEYYLAMATLALNEIILSLIIGLEHITGGASGLRDIPAYSILGISFGNPLSYYFLVWAIALTVIGVVLSIVNSSVGRALIAIHSDEIAAFASGIDCTEYKTRIFALVNIFASLAGSLYAHLMGFIAPDDFSVSTSVNLLVMIFLGGIGTVWGAVVGATFMKLLPEFTSYFLDYELLVNGAILVLVLLFMPKGIVGMLRKLNPS